MAASGLAANMSNTAETCCPPAQLAARPCHAMPRARARQNAPAAPSIQPAQNAQTAGWRSARVNSGNSSAAFVIRAVRGKPRSRGAVGVMSPSLAGGGGGEAQILAVKRLSLCHTFAWSAESRPSSHKRRMAGASPEPSFGTRAAAHPKDHADTVRPEDKHFSHTSREAKLHVGAVIIGHLQ